MSNIVAKPKNTLNIKNVRVCDAYFAKRIDEPEYEETQEEYSVVSGDTLSKIAKAKSTTVSDIKKDNKLTSDVIQLKQKLTITTQTEKGNKVTFEQINTANLGDEVYAIATTNNFLDKKIWLNVRQGKEEGIDTQDCAIQLLVNDQEVFRPEAIVGAYAKDTKITNAQDFKDWAIFKFKLGGKDTKAYADTLEKLTDKKTNLCIIIDAHNPNSIPSNHVGYEGYDGELDHSKDPNCWLDSDGKWFELTKKEEAPWMKHAMSEYNTYKDIEEKTSPLKERIQTYFSTTNAKTGKYTSPWCGAFVNWCFEQTDEYKGTNSGLTALAFDWGDKGNAKAKTSRHKPDGWENGETCQPFYGAVIVLNYSHVAFIVGKNSKKNKYVYIGGNQGGDKSGTQKIQFGSVTIGKEFQIMKPKKYIVTSEQMKLKEYSIDKDGSHATTR